jgi:hypothetical protein
MAMAGFLDRGQSDWNVNPTFTVTFCRANVTVNVFLMELRQLMLHLLAIMAHIMD